jgi:hypothetical protein
LKELSGNMGRSEGDVVEVSIDRMYREEFRFGNLMISEDHKPVNNYDVGEYMIAGFIHFIWKAFWNTIVVILCTGLVFIGFKAN